MSWNARVTSLKTRALQHARMHVRVWGRRAGGVRNTKDRDSPALEVRAGTPAVGCTSWDAVGFSSTNGNRVKVARRAQWRADCDLSVLRQKLGFGHCCSDSQKSHRKPPGKADGEQKPGNISSHYANPHTPSQGTGRLYPDRVA